MSDDIDPGFTASRAQQTAKRARYSAIAGLVVLILTVASVPVLGMVAYAPARTVSAYLGALEAGNAEAALSRLLIGEIEDGWALTDAALDGAASLPTRVNITHAETDDTRSVVTARFDLDGTTRTQDFELVQVPGRWGLFPVWLIDPGELPRLDLQVDGASTVHINSADVPIPRDGLPVLYPVEYSVGFAEHYFRSSLQHAVVDGTAPEVEVRLQAEPTEALQDEVDDLVRAHLDECATGRTLMPTGCTFGYDATSQILGDVEWEILEYPEVELSTQRRRLVTAPAQGLAQVSGRYRNIVTAVESDFEEPIPFTFSAAVTVPEGQPAIEPIEAGLASSGSRGVADS